MGSSEPIPRVAVMRHYYECQGCGIATHKEGEVEDEKETRCTVCREDKVAEYSQSRVVVIGEHLVSEDDEVVEDHFSGGEAREFGAGSTLDPALVEAERECPVCLKSRVCSVEEAEAVFKTSDWGATSMLDDADRVCSYCHCVRIDGVWERMQTVRSRAHHLAQASSSRDKDMSHYTDILTRGIDTGKSRDVPTASGEGGW